MSDLVERDKDLPSYHIREIPTMDPFLNEPEGTRINLRRYLFVLLRRKWLILAITLTVVAGALLEAYTATPLYTASARLQIDPEQTNLLPFQDTYQYSYYMNTSESYQETQIELLKSPALAQRVAKRLDLPNDPVFNAPRKSGLLTELKSNALNSVFGFVSGMFSFSPKNQPSSSYKSKVSIPTVQSEDPKLKSAAAGVSSGISVSPIGGTRLLLVSYTSHDPNLAAAVLNVLMPEFIELSFEKRLESTKQAQDFLQRQLLDLQKNVESSEERLIEYARANDISHLREGESTTDSTLQSLTGELASIESRLITEAARNEALKNATVDQFPGSLTNENITALQQQLVDLEKELARLSVRFGPEWPEVEQTQNQIDIIKSELEREKQSAIDKARADYQTALSHRDRLREAIEEYRGKAAKVSEGAIQYNILKNEVDTNKSLYVSFLQKLKEADISSGLESNNIHIVESAQPPSFPSWPSRRSSASKGLLYGLLFGIGIAYLLEYMGGAIQTPEDVKKALGLATLTVVPKLEYAARSAMIPQRAGEGDIESNPNLLYPRTEVWEAYRALRTSLLLSPSGRAPQVILFTSALPEEGKSTTSLYAAMALAQTGAQTLLIDLDLRKPSLSKILGIYSQTGVTGALSGNSSMPSEIQGTSIPNLYFLPAGPQNPNPPELLGSEDMKTALQVFREEFRYIVLDSPPVMSVTDPVILAHIVDGVVLVMRGGKTAREAVQKAAERIEGVGGRIIGGIINNIDVRKPEYSYYYRYHYYGDYYGRSRRNRAG
jgi:succinoglycan biosynthesis transport protein ExoP